MLYYGIEDSFKSKGVLSKVYSKGVLEGRFNTEDNVGDLGGVEGGVNDKDSKLDSIKGVGVKDSGIKGVNNSTYEQEGVNNSTNTLHPVTSNLDVSLFGLNTEYDNKDLDCLMNMAMQLRKVCNHPNLFEKPKVKSGFNFNKCYFIGRPYVDKGVSRIEMCLPRIVREFVEEKRRGCYSQENKTFSISHMDNTSDTSHNNNTSDISLLDNTSYLRLNNTPNTNLNNNTPSTTHNNTPNTRLIDNTPNACLKNNTSNTSLNNNTPSTTHNNTPNACPMNKTSNTSLNNNTPYTLLDNPTSVKRVKSSIINKEEDLKYFCKNKGYFDIRWPMKTTKDLYKSKYKDYNFIFPKVFNSNITSNFNTVNSYKEKDLLSSISKCKGVLNNNSYNNTLLDEILFNNTPLNNNTYTNTLLDNILYPNTPLYNTPYNNTPSSSLTPSLYKEYVTVPKLDTFISDSGKLWVLDGLLSKLKGEGHRVLLYFQMTKMIDLMEEYLIKKGYTYLRLDGSCKIRDRRDMVREWQSKDIFIFLLSTRAGGLGINLTAADTVIFYDSDWNPTVDQQAMDRAHRLGQTKDVTVYRLITEGTIEERIMERAMKKGEIQRMVIQGGEFQGKYL
ncbi:helicase [Hamiltosporidium magnivora]|uniref:Chromatin-remodeling ATPase INO80 n=1 Tax=Hamiltosporidium magnivora TaxID=148818 RepID=A0A4Q9KVI8_9MICR|nr:helicase [Hamiltosporidium magnivora]